MNGWAQSLRRLLRGITARRWSSVALLVTGALTVAAATLGPLYARAAQETVLHDALTAATTSDTGLHAAFPVDLASGYAVDTALASAPPAGFLSAYPDRILGTTLDTQITLPGSTLLPQQTRIVWRDGFCGHLTVVSGRCPTAPGEAMISLRTLSGGYGYRLGATARLPLLTPPFDGTTTPDTPATVKVVGVYRPNDPDDGFWFGVRYFNAARAVSEGSGDTVDAVFVARSTYSGLGTGEGELDVDYPLDADRVHLAGRAAVAAGVAEVLARQPVGATYADPLAGRLASIDRDNHQVEDGSLLVSLQLAVLALFVLFVATSDALDGRGNDVALAKLRGLSPAATLRLLLAETVLLLVLAVPLGAALGLLAAHVLSSLLLVAGQPVVFPRAAAVAAGGAFVGAVLAVLVAGRKVLRRSVLDEWRGARRDPGRGRRTAVAEAVLAAVAVAGLVLLTTGRGGIFALLAPGLLVLVVALTGIRLVPTVVRLAVPRTAGSAGLGLFLGLRQVARRPAALRLAMLLAVAIGLAVFAVGGESIAARNRTDRAQVEIGAPRRVNVQFSPDADPTRLTAVADPDGRWAMTAATWLPGGGGTVAGAVLGVDPSRLVAVGFPTTHGPSLTTIAHDIDPDPTPAIEIRASTARLSVTESAFSGAAPYVDLVLQPTGRVRQDVRLGVLAAGPRRYTAAVPCNTGCIVAGIGWERPSSFFDEVGATVTVTGLAAGPSATTLTPVGLGLDQPKAWRARSPDATNAATTTRVTVDADGVHETFTSTGGASAGLAHAVSPLPLPLWASTGGIVRPPDLDDGDPRVPQVLDNFGNGYPVTAVGTTQALPGAGGSGVIADVAGLRDELPGFTSEAVWSVWLGANAPPDAIDRLRAAGFDIGTVTSEADRDARLGRQGPALALALLLACAIAATVLAIGATTTAIATTGRRRSFELAALRVVGVSPRALTRATVLEQALLLGSALVLGVPAGVLAAVLAMPVIPQFSDTSPLPLGDTPAVWPVVAIAGGFLVLLVATALLAGVSLVRAAVPARLRGTAQ